MAAQISANHIAPQASLKRDHAHEPDADSRANAATHHSIISGTGRAGTTFLVQLLTLLGLDTGFDDLDSGIDANSHAGLEWDIRDAAAPYIIKSPWLCDYLDKVLDDGTVIIDQAIVTVRDLYAAAESRRDVVRRTETYLRPSQVTGGLWHTDRPELQETILAQQLYKLIHVIAKHDISLTVIHFPRLVHDPEYLFRKLQPLLRDCAYDEFLRVFTKIVKPELVHDFAAEKAVIECPASA